MSLNGSNRMSSELKQADSRGLRHFFTLPNTLLTLATGIGSPEISPFDMEDFTSAMTRFDNEDKEDDDFTDVSLIWTPLSDEEV